MENIKMEENIWKVARKNFEDWNNALQTRNPAEVDKLYRDDCTFIPTFPEAGKEVVTKEGVKDYFEHFLKKLPSGKIVEDVNELRKLNENNFFHVGRYDFEVGPDGDRSIVKAVFTFIWKKDGNGWKIFHHHSSPVK